MKNKEVDILIEKVLKYEPDFKLPAGFAMKMAGVVSRSHQWKANFREYISIVTVVVALMIIAGATYYYTNKVVFLKILEFTSQNLIPLVLVILVLNFVFFADRVLLPLMFNRWSKS
jgi:hypothetical protein